MSAELDAFDDSEDYWVAIKPSRTMPPNVFGPYTRRFATANRNEWLSTYLESARISAVFRAESRKQAEQNAEFYMPPR